MGKLIPNQYLVSLRNIDGAGSIHAAIAALEQEFGAEEFHSLSVFESFVSGHSLNSDTSPLPHLVAEISEKVAALLKQHPAVYLIEQDRVMGITQTASDANCQVQGNPPWGLSRVNQRGSFNEGSYFVNETNQQGANVDIYIIGRDG